MTAWLGSKKSKAPLASSSDTQSNAAEDQQPLSDASSLQELISVSETAHRKLVELITNAATPVLGIRIIAEAPSPMNPFYSMAFVQEGEDFKDDTVLDFTDFKLYIDPDSVALISDLEIDFITTASSSGFRIEKKQHQPRIEGAVAEKLQALIHDQINPALATHGGHITLIEVKDSTAYIQLGGGCQGCGMADVTLKEGIEKLIKENIPEITEILDTTDHAGGSNPYYQSR